MSPPGTFTGDRIRQLLGEVADRLDPALPRATVVIVGGSLLAWHGLRLATEDVDSSVRLAADVRAVVRSVAEDHRLAVDWLNDHAAAWHPRTLTLAECDVLADHPRLLVLGAPLVAVFLMKLNRSQPQDVTDMIVIWPHVAALFPTAAAVVEAYYAAFPAERLDEYLVAQVVDVARRAGTALPTN